MSYRDARDLNEFWQTHSEHTAGFILAVLSRTEGATYRKAGAKKIISEKGDSCGMLSGGCLEAAIVRDALKFLNENGESEICFDTSHESDRLLGYQKGCRGKIWVRFEKLARHTVEQSEMLFAELRNTRRLIIFGCGPDATPVSELLGFMGLPHVMIDHRKDLLLAENFKAADELIYGPPTSTAKYVKDGDAVLLMSHNYEADLNILKDLAAKNLSYVGVLGPRQRFDQLCADLEVFFAVKWPEKLQAVTHAPVGIKMRCQDPHDIALAIVTEIAIEQIFTNEPAGKPSEVSGEIPPSTAAHQQESFSHATP
jgi:xanthine dehydrogenase accessory factor